jgi:hypothetical protein
MKTIWIKLGQRGKAKLWLAFAVGAALLSMGCHVIPIPNQVQDMGPRYHPSNVYRPIASLPLDIRRVALLPLVIQDDSGFLRDGVEKLQPLVYAELEKCKRFDIIPVSADQLRQLTGKPGWRTDEPLPPDFFARISEATGCDAVLFCQLTRYEPYQPLAMGWKFSLVANLPPGEPSLKEVRSKILWAADEVMDAGEPGVSNAARDYYAGHIHNEEPSADPSTILNSPARFGQYTLAALLQTLPERGGVTR